MIIGPSHTPTLNQSVKVVRDVYVGKMPRLEFTWGFVDVRCAHRGARGTMRPLTFSCPQ